MVVHVPVLDVVAAAAVQMAAAAVNPVWPADALGNGSEIDALSWQTSFALNVGAGVIMANQAVNLGFIRKIEISAVPAIARVAGCAAFPIGLNADAEIIDGILLTDGYRFRPPIDLVRPGFPGPMGRRHHLVSLISVAFQASLGDL